MNPLGCVSGCLNGCFGLLLFIVVIVFLLVVLSYGLPPCEMPVFGSWICSL